MKNAIKRLLDKISSIITKVEEYNEYLNDNRYSDRSTRYLSFNVKAYDYIDKNDLEELDEFKALSQENKELVREEFDEERIEGVYNHVFEDKREWFRDDAISGGSYNGIFKHMNAIDISFMGRQGGHLCLGEVSEWEMELCETSLNYYPFYNWSRDHGMIWETPEDINECIKELKDYFEVTTQKEVYQLLKADVLKEFEPFISDIDKNMEQFLKLEEDIKEYKKNFKDDLLYNLTDEVQQFIENNFSYEYAILAAEQGDYSLLNSILKIEGDKIITNLNAVVSLKAAIKTIKQIENGKDVKSGKVSAYTINVVDRREKDTYVKIGCHLFSLSQTKLQLHLNS